MGAILRASPVDQRRFTRDFLKRPVPDPMGHAMVVIAMSFTSATVTVLLAMVALVVVTGALEAHTPAPRARPTKVTLPRRV